MFLRGARVHPWTVQNIVHKHFQFFQHCRLLYYQKPVCMQIAFMVVQLPHLQPYLSDYSVDVLMVVIITYLVKFGICQKIKLAYLVLTVARYTKSAE